MARVRESKPVAMCEFALGKARTARAGKEKFASANLLVPIPVLIILIFSIATNFRNT